MAITFNNLGDCTTDSIGSGRVDCNVDAGLLIGFILTPRSWKLDTVSGTFTKANYETLVKNGTFIPYTGLFNFEQTNEENVTETAPNTGAISIIRSGLPSFTFTFNDGNCFHKSLYNKQGNRNYNLILVFEKGLKLVKSGDDLRGYGINSISVSSYMEKTSESAKSVVTVQLDSAEDYNMNSVILANDGDLGFKPADINGVIEANLIIGTNTATSIPVKITSSCNSSVGFSGLDDLSNFTLINNSTGATVTPTAVSEGANGNYTITGTALPTANFTLLLNATDDLDQFYKGKAVK